MMTLQYGHHDRDPNQIPTYIRWIGLIAVLLAITLAILTSEGKGQTIGVGDTLTFNDREVTEQVDCYDGDTCTYPGINRDFRLAGIDAPEMDGPCRELARSAQAHLQQMVRLPPQKVAVVDIGEHGRWIVEINVGNLNVNSWMLARGFATRWPIREPSTLCGYEQDQIDRVEGSDRRDLRIRTGTPAPIRAVIPRLRGRHGEHRPHHRTGGGGGHVGSLQWYTVHRDDPIRGILHTDHVPSNPGGSAGGQSLRHQGRLPRVCWSGTEPPTWQNLHHSSRGESQ